MKLLNSVAAKMLGETTADAGCLGGTYIKWVCSGGRIAKETWRVDRCSGDYLLSRVRTGEPC